MDAIAKLQTNNNWNTVGSWSDYALLWTIHKNFYFSELKCFQGQNHELAKNLAEAKKLNAQISYERDLMQRQLWASESNAKVSTYILCFICVIEIRKYLTLTKLSACGFGTIYEMVSKKHKSIYFNSFNCY